MLEAPDEAPNTRSVEEIRCRLIGLIVFLIVVGLVLYLIDRLPIDGAIKNVIHIVVIIVMILYLLSAFGFVGTFNRPIVP